MVVNYPSWLPAKLVECLKAWRQSRKLILFIVFVALFLDNMLLTTVGRYFYVHRVSTANRLLVYCAAISTKFNGTQFTFSKAAPTKKANCDQK